MAGRRLIDHRAHGDSEGRTITFGLNESRDVLSWVKYISESWGGDRKIMLNGISMGAAAVLMASALDLPEQVVGIAADCPYSSAKQIIKKVICEMGLPKDLVYPFVRLGARIFGRFDPDKCNPSDAVRSSKLPILLVHGEADGFVPLEMSMEIAEANPEIEFYAFSNADHGKSFIADTKRYKKILSELTRRCLRL